MKFIYITLLFLLIFLEGRSQTWNEWEGIGGYERAELVSNRFLDNRLRYSEVRRMLRNYSSEK